MLERAQTMRARTTPEDQGHPPMKDKERAHHRSTLPDQPQSMRGCVKY